MSAVHRLCKNASFSRDSSYLSAKSRFPDLLETLVVASNGWSGWNRVRCFASRGSPVRSRSRPPILYFSPFWNLGCNFGLWFCAAIFWSIGSICVNDRLWQDEAKAYNALEIFGSRPRILSETISESREARDNGAEKTRSQDRSGDRERWRETFWAFQRSAGCWWMRSTISGCSGNRRSGW